MKKILIAALALVSLCSCASSSTKLPASQSDDVTTSAVAPATSDKAESASSGVVSSGIPDETTSAKTAEDGVVLPEQSFIGAWSTDESKTDQILIYEITPVSVKFNTGISGLFGFDATGMLADDGFIFGDGVSPAYGGPEGLRGKLEFGDNSITVIYEDFGTIPDAEYYPNKYTFTLKDENSDAIVSQHKANLPD